MGKIFEVMPRSEIEEKMSDNAQQSASTIFNSDGSITVNYASGLSVTTIFNSNGTITEQYSGIVNITKTTTFNSDGSISEVVV